MTMQRQVFLKVASFQDGIRGLDTNWEIEKKLFDDTQLEFLYSAAMKGESIHFTVEGPARMILANEI